MPNLNSDRNAAYDIDGTAFGDGGVFDFSESSSSTIAIPFSSTSDKKGDNGGGRGKPPPPEPEPDPDPSGPVTTFIISDPNTYTSGLSGYYVVTTTVTGEPLTQEVYAGADYDTETQLEAGETLTYIGDTTIASEEFNIDIDFLESFWTIEITDEFGVVTETIDLMAAFISAAEFISSVISGDKFTLWGNDDSGFFDNGLVYDASEMNDYPFTFDIDDLYITAEILDIDGEGGVLGRAGPTWLMSAEGSLPFSGLMEFDVADALALYESGMWENVVLHEMLHVMGIGTMWDNFDLINSTFTYNLDTRNPNDGSYEYTFNGSQFFMDEFGIIYIESDGGSGTALGHWDDETYDGELMTGYLYDQNGEQPNGIGLTQMSIASLGELGYDLDFLSISYTNLENDAYAYA